QHARASMAALRLLSGASMCQQQPSYSDSRDPLTVRSMFRPATCSTVIAVMLWCAVRVLGENALAVTPTVVEFEGASQPLVAFNSASLANVGKIQRISLATDFGASSRGQTVMDHFPQ